MKFEKIFLLTVFLMIKVASGEDQLEKITPNSPYDLYYANNGNLSMRNVFSGKEVSPKAKVILRLIRRFPLLRKQSIIFLGEDPEGMLKKYSNRNTPITDADIKFVELLSFFKNAIGNIQVRRRCFDPIFQEAQGITAQKSLLPQKKANYCPLDSGDFSLIRDKYQCRGLLVKFNDNSQDKTLGKYGCGSQWRCKSLGNNTFAMSAMSLFRRKGRTKTLPKKIKDNKILISLKHKLLKRAKNDLTFNIQDIQYDCQFIKEDMYEVNDRRCELLENRPDLLQDIIDEKNSSDDIKIIKHWQRVKKTCHNKLWHLNDLGILKQTKKGQIDILKELTEKHKKKRLNELKKKIVFLHKKVELSKEQKPLKGLAENLSVLKQRLSNIENEAKADGEGVTVAVIGTGMSNHPYLREEEIVGANILSEVFHRRRVNGIVDTMMGSNNLSQKYMSHETAVFSILGGRKIVTGQRNFVFIS